MPMRRQKRLLDDAIDAFGIAGAGKPRHQHRLAAEERRHEHDHDQEDLPADADGRVGGEPDADARPARGR